MEITHNPVSWFEIPVGKMERAIKFYEAVFDFKLERHQFPSIDMAWFPWIIGSEGSGGSLVYHEDFYIPSKEGPLIYFTAFSGDLNNELARVEPNGGKVTVPKTRVSEEHGYCAVFIDTEGNRVAMHSIR